MNHAQKNSLSQLTERFLHAHYVTRAVYALLAAHCFVSLSDWELYFEPGRLNYEPVWPVCWVSKPYAGTVWLMATVVGLALSTVATQVSGSRWTRILAAACLFIHFSMEDSRDAIRHNEHGLLWTAVVFACLPAISSLPANRRKQLAFLRVFVTAQFLLLLFYWMAGSVKVLTSVAQGLRGERTLLHPDSGALVIGEWLLRGDAGSLLGRWFIEHKYVAWVCVVGGVLLELAAVLPLVWRRSQALIASGLIAMHVGIGFSMNVWFPENVALLSLLLLAGPTIRPPPLYDEKSYDSA